jgi:acyl-CoA reductase-like NAD-dependent aldehyde dehydrogenase
MPAQPVLIAGRWRAAKAGGTFYAENPATGEKLPDEFPVSTWADCEAALDAATAAANELPSTPPEKIARFLTRFAERIEERKSELVEIAHLETALPKSPRLVDVELPRTTGQLRQAAAAAQALKVIEQLEGNLTGCVYSDTRGSDDALYDQLAPLLRSRVGRLLNDKMPTGVAVSSAMNHGGTYPSTGHPGFTAVGIPASLRRFAALHYYDNVRSHRLPAALQNKNPNGIMWRLIDGQWSQADIAG